MISTEHSSSRRQTASAASALSSCAVPLYARGLSHSRTTVTSHMARIQERFAAIPQKESGPRESCRAARGRRRYRTAGLAAQRSDPQLQPEREENLLEQLPFGGVGASIALRREGHEPRPERSLEIA